MRDLFGKPLTASFDVPNSSSDGGAVLLKAADQKLGLVERLSRCLVDRRQPGKVSHQLEDLVAQRIYAIACGYPDGNDADRLREDPVHRLVSGLDPAADDQSLASQPTLSRFENSAGQRELYGMGSTLAECVIDRNRNRLRRRKVKKITVDLDVTDDPSHGCQQFTFFNGFYDTYCYLPLLGFLTFDDEAEQQLFAAILRPGNVPTRSGVLELLTRTLPRLREVFPKAKLIVRLDAGFCFPELFDYLDSFPNLGYVVAMAKNPRVSELCEPEMTHVRELSKNSDVTTRTYGEVLYQAKTWSCERRIIFKAEVLQHDTRDSKDNLRLVVTNLKTSPRHLYEKVYCKRGDSENRIKELLLGLSIDRTSCSRFLANQFRVLLTAAAFVLFQEIRWAARKTSLARAQVQALRERLLKIGVWVTCSCRRFLFRLPKDFPFRREWMAVATELGARSG